MTDAETSPRGWATLAHYGDLRTSLAWNQADALLVRRATGRLVTVLAWVGFAVDAVGWEPVRSVGWTVAGVLLSVVHARRPLVVAVSGRLRGRVGRAWRWLMRYPDVAHVNPVALVEVPTLLIPIVLTRFVIPPDVETYVILAGLAGGLFWLAMVNLTAHPVWHAAPAPRLFAAFRWWLAPCVALVMFAVLRHPAAGLVHEVGVIAISFGGGLGTHFAGRLVDHVHREMVRVNAVTRGIVLEEVASVVHAAAKNQARAVLEQLDELPPGSVRDDVRRLCESVVLLERNLADDRPAAATARQMCEVLLPEGGARGPTVEVVEDVDDTSALATADGLLAFVALSDLLRNAVAASTRDSRPIEVSFRDDGEELTISVVCHCGRGVPQANPGRSLWRLASMIGRRGGRLLVAGEEERHITHVTWPRARTEAA